VGVARKEFDRRLGVSLPSMGSNPDPQRLASVAQEAERLDFDSVWVPDHVLRVFAPILDPLTTLSFVAGATQSIGLGTNVLIAPYRHPVILANEAASLDILSGGRFVLGVGAGWNEEEFPSLGISVHERGRRTDEVLEAMRRLWAGGPATYEGRYYSFASATLGTSPRTEGGPPILVGGYSDAALRRALRFGEKWGGFSDSPERIREVRERLERLSEEVGRDPRELEVVTTCRIEVSTPDTEDLSERVAGELMWLREAGVDLCVLVISPIRSEALSWVAEEVAPRL
jgi:probable F420-dependent oxidoreductase